MQYNDDLKERAEAVSFWLSPENAGARKELAERQPELAQWLSMVEQKVEERMKQTEKEEATMKE